MEERIQKVRQIIKSQQCDAVLLSSVPNIFYVTGYGGFSIEERDAYVLITPQESYVISSALYAEAIKIQVPHMHSIERNRQRSFQNIVADLVARHKIKNCGFEYDNLTVYEYQTIASLPFALRPIDLSTLRSIKHQDELDKMQKACHIVDEAFTYICTQLKPGITEKELSYLLEIFFKQQHADNSFRPIFAFGANAAVPHHLVSDSKLERNTCILMDFGAKYDHYCSDMSRTVFFGKAPDKFKQAYQTTIDAQQKGIDHIKTKLEKNEEIFIADVDIIARDYVVSQGYPPFNHASHGIGIADHEHPRFHPKFKDILKENMAFSIEPGIYFPGKFGIRIEDDFTVKNGKLIELTKSTKELLEM